MKKRHLISIIGVIIMVLILPFTALGCIEDDDAKTTTKAIITPKDQEQDTRITSIDATVKAHTTQIAVLEKVGGTSSGVTKQQYDEAIARIASLESAKATMQADIAALKTDVAALKSGTTTTSTGTGTTTTTTGQVTVTTNPASIQTFSGNQMCYTMRISNGTNQWIYAKPIVTFNTTQTVVVSAVDISASWGSYNMTGSTCWNISPLGSSTTAVLCIPINCGASSLGEVQLAAGQYVDVLVCVKITSADPRIWTVSHSISTRTI